MKIIILCGGLGSRLSEETKKKPKPMVEIGKFPILIHIMKLYQYYGFNDFILALSYHPLTNKPAHYYTRAWVISALVIRH